MSPGLQDPMHRKVPAPCPGTKMITVTHSASNSGNEVMTPRTPGLHTGAIHTGVFHTHGPDAPLGDDLETVAALAADLSAAGYGVVGVEDLLGEVAGTAMGRDQTVPALLVTRPLLARSRAAPLAVLTHLFLLGGHVDAAQLAGALPRAGADGALSMGLVERDGGAFQAAVDLRPYDADDDPDGTGDAGLWVASDLGAHQAPGALRRDHVLGIGHASLTLAQLVLRAPVDRALDLGTGCGIQTFHLLRHARTVVATDISARALAFARFNLLLNARVLDLDPEHLEDRVKLRQGNLLDPVAGERFDLVVSNPPFVITPRRLTESSADRYTYRDGGLPGDELIAGLLRGLPGVLAPGAAAQLLGNWEIRAAAGDRPSWHSRLEGWLAPDIDAWVIQREEISPAEYAETWLRDASQDRDHSRYEQDYAAYLADFAARDTTSIGFGLVWLRRPAGTGAVPLRRFEEITHPLGHPVGPHLGAGIAAHDWLAVRSDDTLGGEHVQVADDVTEERHQKPGAEHPGVILLRRGAGLRRSTVLSTELAGFVSAADGELSIGQIIGALAALLKRDDDAFRSALLAQVRHLVRDGFLLPAGPTFAAETT